MKIARIALWFILMMTSSAALGTPAGHLDIVDAVDQIPALKAAGLHAKAVTAYSVTLSDGEVLPISVVAANTPYGQIVKSVQLR